MQSILPETARDIAEYEKYMIRILDRMYMIDQEVSNKVVIRRRKRGIPQQPLEYLKMLFSYEQAKYVIYQWFDKWGVRGNHSQR